MDFFFQPVAPISWVLSFAFSCIRLALLTFEGSWNTSELISRHSRDIIERFGPCRHAIALSAKPNTDPSLDVGSSIPVQPPFDHKECVSCKYFTFLSIPARFMRDAAGHGIQSGEHLARSIYLPWLDYQPSASFALPSPQDSMIPETAPTRGVLVNPTTQTISS